MLPLATFQEAAPGNHVPHSLSLSSRFLTVMEAAALLSAALLASVVTFKNAVIMRGRRRRLLFF